jgi:MFS family permease
MPGSMRSCRVRPVSVRDTAQPGGQDERPAVRLLQAAAATSAFDRFVVGPLLLTVAAEFGVTLAAAAAAASAYFLCYGLSQPVWGLTSDRVSPRRWPRRSPCSWSHAR